MKQNRQGGNATQKTIMVIINKTVTQKNKPKGFTLGAPPPKEVFKNNLNIT